jgi:hypothetical protein
MCSFKSFKNCLAWALVTATLATMFCWAGSGSAWAKLSVTAWSLLVIK